MSLIVQTLVVQNVKIGAHMLVTEIPGAGKLANGDKIVAAQTFAEALMRLYPAQLVPAGPASVAQNGLPGGVLALIEKAGAAAPADAPAGKGAASAQVQASGAAGRAPATQGPASDSPVELVAMLGPDGENIPLPAEEEAPADEEAPAPKKGKKKG